MNDRCKRARLRAWRRGFREIDLILGGFADSCVEGLSEDDLAAFEQLLELPDQDVYEWIIGRESAPMELAGLIARIQMASLPAARPE